jgi:hypothetical protein
VFKGSRHVPQQAEDKPDGVFGRRRNIAEKIRFALERQDSDVSASGFFHIDVIEPGSWRRDDSQPRRGLQDLAVDSVPQTNPQNLRCSNFSQQAIAVQIGQPEFTGAA